MKSPGQKAPGPVGYDTLTSEISEEIVTDELFGPTGQRPSNELVVMIERRQ
jgi:hypothetical protein